jgi:hypothetical protein
MISIPTVFDGTEYRSRLEAKWAALFDLIGWRHDFEPFAGDWYIPDFTIAGPQPLVVEVKPAVVEADFDAALDKVTLGVFEHWEHDVLILGADPLPQLPGRCDGHPPCGLLGVFSDEPTEPVWMFDTGYWYSCTACGRLAVCHRRPPFVGRPCAHRGDNNAGPVDPATVRGMWSEAAWRVKWGGR